MIKKFLKITCFIFVFSVILFGTVFAENIDLSIFYGVNNVAKNGSRLPIELKLQNKENVEFNGYVLVNAYETNRSVYVYRSAVDIKARESVYVNKSISINNRVNTIVVEIYNNQNELVKSERTNVDLSYLDDTLIVGVITDDYYTLNYIDGINIHNNLLRIKTVEINEDIYSYNKNAFDQLDMLIISDIDTLNFNDSFKFAIQTYFSSGKPFLMGLGGKNGSFIIPDYLNKYFNGPTIDAEYENINVTSFDLVDSRTAYVYDGNLSVKYIRDNNILLICSPVSFKDLGGIRDGDKIFTEIVENSLGSLRLDRMLETSRTYISNDYYNINSLLNMIDKLKLPDIFIISIMLVFYVAVLTIVIYVYLRNVNKREVYGGYAVAFAILFSFIMFYMGYNVMKKNTFLTYLSVVDIKNESTNETAFLNFRTSESGSYEFDTSLNNKIYPLVKSTNEPILSTNFIDIKNVKRTSIFQAENRIVVNVENALDFDSNIFVYENNNYLNDIYNVDCSVNRFNGEITGRITNNMNIPIKDASLLLFGRVLKIGDIDANHSVSLSRAIDYGVPVGNNSMLSEILASGNNQSILKYYLDEKIYEYYNFAMLFGFIDNNVTIDINSSDVGDVYGTTLLARRINVLDSENMRDICSLSEEVNNISGYYEYANNSIKGDTEVINEYSFGQEYLLSNIYFENITSYDLGKLDFNVPFYGEIAAFNIETRIFDTIYEYKIPYENLNKYLTKENKIILRFTPSSMDPLYRNICLPVVRAVGSK